MFDSRNDNEVVRNHLESLNKVKEGLGEVLTGVGSSLCKEG